MRAGTVQINWHDTKPVLTLDFHPVSGLLATGGADFDIKLWRIGLDEGGEKKIPTATYQSSLSYHGCAVNVIRFSPSGEQLASGADGGELLLWKLHVSEAGETWKVLKTLSFHRKDVLDLQWSTDGAFLISGSVDNSCIIWDINKGSVHQILDAHFHYVQGVAFDPLSKYAASLSSDRTCRIYMNKPQTKGKGNEKMNYVCQHVISKAEQQQSVDETKCAKNHLFHDETLPSFFRRLAWSPDGTFLLVPAGSYKASSASAPVNTAYIFSRKDLSRPAILLPGANKPVIAVRFCPITFSLRGTNSAGFFKLPYRLIFAVATLNSLYIYDTESVPPIAILAGLHYAAITDIAWSQNGQYLALSSQDGYCTLVEFENGELGSPISSPDQKGVISDQSKSSVVQEPDPMVIETPTSNAIVAAAKQNPKSETNEDPKAPLKQTSTPVISDQSKGPMAQEPDHMVIETPKSDATIASADQNPEAETKADTKAPLKPTPTPTPVQNKPAKRRIIPMAIDPQ